MSSFKHEFVNNDDVNLHVVSATPIAPLKAPPVFFCHGMPGLWYSWRHQLHALSEAGYMAVALDQRGYGRSDRPCETASYSSNHTVGDLLALLEHFNVEQGIFVGQDFGAAQVYNLALRHPERVAAVVGLACPYDYDFSGRGGAGRAADRSAKIERPFARPDLKPSECFAAIAEHQFFYAHYFQTVGPAEAELAANPRTFLRRLFWALSGKGHLLDWSEHPVNVKGYIDVLAEPESQLPWPWMSEDDLEYYVTEFMNAPQGLEFIGGLSAYRAADLNWDIAEPYANERIKQPSLFIAGAQDPVITMIDLDAFNTLKSASDDLRGIHLIEQAGHFVQQEQADACNAHLLTFLEGLR